MIYQDREIMRLYSSWEIERDEICDVLLRHFENLGVYLVYPYAHAEVLRKEIIRHLLRSEEIQVKRSKIQKEIAKAREKSRSRGGG